MISDTAYGIFTDLDRKIFEICSYILFLAQEQYISVQICHVTIKCLLGKLTANCPSVGALCCLIVGCLRAYDTVCGEVSAQFYSLDKAELATECIFNEYARGRQNHI